MKTNANEARWKFIESGEFPLKRNKRAWSKTHVHFVLVKVHERHYKGDVGRSFRRPYVRVRSTDFNKASTEAGGID